MAACGFYWNLFAYRYDHDSPFDSPWARSAGCQELALQFNRQRLFDQFSPCPQAWASQVRGRRQTAALDPCTGWELLADLAILLRFSPSPFGRSLSYLARASQSTPELGQWPGPGPCISSGNHDETQASTTAPIPESLCCGQTGQNASGSLSLHDQPQKQMCIYMMPP